MKEIKNDIRQRRAYVDHEGYVYILCEGNETKEDVIKAYVEPEREWHETSYTFVKTIAEFAFEDAFGKHQSYEGTIVVLFGVQPYLD